jgi:molecular chaperone IbpA
MALAGFKKDEIKVTWQEDLLTVEGDRGKRNDNENYVYKSIGHRTFKKIFSLSELVEVMGANFEDGILHIHLQKNIPESQKPKVISIE